MKYRMSAMVEVRFTVEAESQVLAIAAGKECLAAWVDGVECQEMVVPSEDCPSAGAVIYPNDPDHSSLYVVEDVS